MSDATQFPETERFDERRLRLRGPVNASVLAAVTASFRVGADVARLRHGGAGLDWQLSLETDPRRVDDWTATRIVEELARAYRDGLRVGRVDTDVLGARLHGLLASATPGVAAHHYSDDAAELRIPASLCDRLRARSGALGVGITAIVASAVAGLVAGVTRQSALSLLMPVVRAESDDWDDPRAVRSEIRELRVSLLPSDTLLELVRRVQRGIEDLLDVSVAIESDATDDERMRLRFALDPDPIEPHARWDAAAATLQLLRRSGPAAMACDAHWERGEIALRWARESAEPRGVVDALCEVLPLWLAAFADDPSAVVSALPLVTTARAASDFQRLHAGTERDLASVAPIARQIEAQAKRSPDTVAVHTGSVALTYAELDAAARAVCAALRDRGIGRDDVVALCLERSPDLVSAMLGVLYAGAAYLPIDAEHPVARVESIVRDAKPALLLTSAAALPALRDAVASTVDVLSVAQLGATRADASIAAIGDEDLAYVIYTSGSTGRPKGVEITQRGLKNHIAGTAALLRAAPEDRFLQQTSVSFDAAVWDFFVPLTCGATLVLAPAGAQRDPEALLAFARTNAVTVMQLVPSALREFLCGVGLREVTTLRLLACGGEALDADSVRTAMEQRPGLEVVNFYGPTEGSNVTSAHVLRTVPPRAMRVPIGRPASNVRCWLRDAYGRPVPAGAVAELWIGGAGVARGYRGQPELTKRSFVALPENAHERVYRSGDLVAMREDGTLEFRGRADEQLKIRGHRVEPAEVESALRELAGVTDAAVLGQPDASGEMRLVAYVAGQGLDAQGLRTSLAATIAPHLVPSVVELLPSLPRLSSGKLDRAALPAPRAARPDSVTPFATPQGDLEHRVARCFAQVLGVQPIGRDDNFFELGGTSLLALRALDAIATDAGLRVSVPTFIAHPSVRGVVERAQGAQRAPAPRESAAQGSGGSAPSPNAAIAIIGFAGRFPGADDVEALWKMVLAGGDGTTDFALDAVESRDPGYVNARGVLSDPRRFDHAFFGMPKREAEVMDPQQRIVLELAWTCIEHAGYAPDRLTGRTGVFAGVGPPTYLTHHIQSRSDIQQQLGELLVTIGNDKDYAALRVANELDLRGPAISLNTACSTSLVAVAMAVDSLRAGRCRQALAGGATVRAPVDAGYQYEEGAMLSPDARTRTFSASAKGTSFNDGAAMVLLKRLDDALADGDQVFAIIRGVAITNDGGGKASFTAPSVDGQEATILAAQEDAGIDAASIAYVEAHGTATPLGDPVEVEALTRAFRRSTNAVGFCRLGSVKSNVGHLVTAAGATGLINATLALSREMFPPVAHFDAPNPRIGFDGSPFVVSDRATPWPRGATPRRAAVSSFGVGGTNAHVVLEEAPAPASRPSTSGLHTLRLSARDASALSAMQDRLAAHLQADSSQSLADIAFTLREGRSEFPHRSVVVARDHASAARALRDVASRVSGTLPSSPPGVVLLFPGQGAQHVGMGAELYDRELVFREAFERCASAANQAGARDLAEQVFRGDAERLKDTALAQPAIFSVSYALAAYWRSRGLEPEALIGHSVGEFVAAAVAGVMDLEDALRLVSLRGQLMSAQPRGAMLSVRAAAERIEPMLPRTLSLAGENGPQLCVVAGPSAEIAAFAERLGTLEIASKTLETSHAFHSAMMDPVIAPFREAVARVSLAPPQTAIVSTATGSWLTSAEATSPEYWAQHLRLPVRFAPAVRSVLARGAVAFVECGPRSTLSTLVRQQRAPDDSAPFAVSSLGDGGASEWERLQLSAAGLWTVGIALREPEPTEAGRRVQLPTYPFAPTRLWIEPAAPATRQSETAARLRDASAGTAAPVAVAGSALRASGEALRKLFEEISGLDLSQVDAATPFVQLGLDSLTLTQAAQRIKKVFAVPVTFRELMETHRSLAELTAHLERVRVPVADAPVARDASAGREVVEAAAPSQKPERYDVAKAFGAIARIDHRASTLTERQRARLDAFIRRYTERTQRSKAHTEQHRGPLADPRVVSGFRPELKEITYQIVVDRSEGARLWDLDGNEYVDALAGFGMCLFGWQPSFVQDAVRRQLERGYEIGPMHPTAAVVAELVCELSGCERAALVNTGSEAVMGALRMARTATARGRIVTFAGSYHGTFDEVLVRAGRDGRAAPAVPGVMPTMFGEVRVLDYGSDAALDVIRAEADEIAAVLVEPVQSRRPELQPREFLQRLRALTAERGICLIFDEVITGFRSHLGGVQHLFDVRADLVTYGKVIGGGMPIGVIAGNARYMSAIDGGAWRFGDASAPSADITYLAGTFVRHPLALAAAQASLEHLRDAGPALQERLNAGVAAMVQRMNAAARARGAPVEVRHFSSMWRIAFTEEHPWQVLLYAMMRSRGIHILDNFPCYGTTAHREEDFARIAAAFEAALDELQEADFLPRRAAASGVDPSAPPVPGARLGRDESGMPAWYVPDPARAGQFVKHGG